MTRNFVLAAILSLGLGIPIHAQAQPAKTDLRIYWIDVEGGAATLFVSPSGESMLYDTGYSGNDDRDAKRVYEMAQRAGVTQLDHVVISHWHDDHVGGLASLAKLIPIAHFYDHGDGVEDADKARRDLYRIVAASKRTIVKPGDTIPFAGVEVKVVSAEGPVIGEAINQGGNGGGPNPLCENAVHMSAAAPENQRMVGFLLTYGKFKLLSLRDLDWQKEMELACPNNKVGRVTVYEVGRHGGLDDSAAPALLGAIRPQVMIVNNGPMKGLGGTDDRAHAVDVPGQTPAPYEKNSYLRLARNPGAEGVWQLHASLLDKDPVHNTAQAMTANIENGTDGNWLRMRVTPEGEFTVTNSRNGFGKTYKAR